MESNIIINEDFAAIHAYLCADGYVSGDNPFAKHKYYHIALRNMNEDLLNDFQSKFEAVFGKRPIISRQLDRCKIGNKEIFLWLKNNFGSFHSANWALPKCLMKRRLLAAWLRSFFDCESWVEVTGRKTRAIGLESINYFGLLSIYHALRGFFRIDSFIHQKKKGKIWYLGIYGKNNLLRFRKKIGFRHPSKKAKLDKAISSFMDYNWKFPVNHTELKGFILGLLKKRIKETNPHRIRICSNKRKNLNELSKALYGLFGINSKVSKPMFNGFGTKYFEIAIKKKESVNLLAELTK